MMSILSVLLLILKYIGIVLGIILLILLIALLIVLFIPFQYSVYISGNQSMNIDMDVEIKWFIKLIYYRYIMENSKKKSKTFKLFGRKIINDKNNPLNAKKEKRSNENVKTYSNHDINDFTKDCKVNKYNKVGNDNKNDSLKCDDKQHIFIEKQKKILKSLEETDKANYINEEMFRETEEQTNEDSFFTIKDILNYPNKKEIIQYTYQFIKKVIIHVKPYEFSSKLEFGLEDPSNTGYILAGIGIIQPYFGNSVHIKGNFDKKILMGDINGKGKFQIGIVLIYIIRYLLKKPIKQIVKKYLFTRKDG